MTRDYVLNQLTSELVEITGDLKNQEVFKRYLNMALDIGVNHFTKDMEEVAQMDLKGNIIRRFKGVIDAANKTGITQGYISSVLTGKQHSTGGFMFRKTASLKINEEEK